MLPTFRTYQLALEFYRECEKLSLPYYLKDQILRASSSVVLNLAEGSAKPTKKDKLKFYYIALASHREVQAVLEMQSYKELDQKADHLGASLYKLTHQP